HGVWPCFYPQWERALCRDTTFARVQRQAEGTEPDFDRATTLLHELVSRCEAAEHDAEAQRWATSLAARHVLQATERCQQQDFVRALALFQHIATRPYPAASLVQAREEADRCRLAFATALAAAGHVEEALGQLDRVVSTTTDAMREVALGQVRQVVSGE